MESREGRAKLRASKLERTIPLMQSEQWGERFKAEYRQLNVRIEALTDCIKYHDALNPLEVDLLTQQLIAMTNLILILITSLEKLYPFPWRHLLKGVINQIGESALRS